MGWLYVVEWLARLILLFLVGLSVWSIAIILERKKFYKQITEIDQNAELMAWIKAGDRQKITQWAAQGDGLRAGTLRVLLERRTTQQMEKSVASFWAERSPSLEKGLSILGTLGSTTPFVGLLGTILGIIVAFGELSTGQLDSQKIMFALAEALTLTAVGLAVAIPAVVAFNFYSRQLRALLRECESLKDLAISYFSEQGSS